MKKASSMRFLLFRYFLNVSALYSHNLSYQYCDCYELGICTDLSLFIISLLSPLTYYLPYL